MAGLWILRAGIAIWSPASQPWSCARRWTACMTPKTVREGHATLCSLQNLRGMKRFQEIGLWKQTSPNAHCSKDCASTENGE